MAPGVERDRSMARGRLQNVERHTSQALQSMGTDARFVRCNGHMLDQAISRPVCSAHHSPPWAVRRVSKLCALKRLKASHGGVTAACRQASGTWESDHGLGSALSEFGYLRVPSSLAAASRSRPSSCSLAAFSACGGELGGPRNTALFVAHARLLDLSG